MITITHTHADGTLIDGSHKAYWAERLADMQARERRQAEAGRRGKRGRS